MIVMIVTILIILTILMILIILTILMIFLMIFWWFWWFWMILSILWWFWMILISRDIHESQSPSIIRNYVFFAVRAVGENPHQWPWPQNVPSVLSGRMKSILQTLISPCRIQERSWEVPIHGRPQFYEWQFGHPCTIEPL